MKKIDDAVYYLFAAVIGNRIDSKILIGQETVRLSSTRSYIVFYEPRVGQKLVSNIPHWKLTKKGFARAVSFLQIRRYVGMVDVGMPRGFFLGIGKCEIKNTCLISLTCDNSIW